MTSSVALDVEASPQVPILVLAGPTAVGKTEAAVALCRALDAEIVGADSVQVYRGLNIGSAKPTASDLQGVTHHLLDCVDPGERLDAARYARLADACIAEVAGRGRAVVVVGGTGLWIRALVRGLMPAPPVDRAVRAELEARWDREGAGPLHARLRAVDPVAAARIHTNDKRRVVRALDMHAQTGQAAGELRAAHALGTPRRPTLMLWLDLPLPSWEARVARRVERMFEAGLVEETRTLVERHGRDAPALRSVGYRQLLDHLDGALDLDEARARVLAATRRYAHQQRNWLRSEPSVALQLRPEQLFEPELLQRVRSHLVVSAGP
jgi:tRNA dimethylallyltransferase